ncbi:MAG: hypothetical protein JWN34_3076 [Bryobacterales bacterium]|nr:hypothetical protein [Bryobacterales bacterium]
MVAPLNSDEFLRLYDREEGGLRQFELLDGEVVERPMPNFRHDLIKNNVCKALDRYLAANPGHLALVETTFKLGPRVTFTPDHAVIAVDRVGRVEFYSTGAPDIAFEVISSETADRLKYKTDLYLEFGSRAVCCIYPNRRNVVIFTPNSILQFKGSEHLAFPGILPGFSLPLSDVFASAQE